MRFYKSDLELLTVFLFFLCHLFLLLIIYRISVKLYDDFKTFFKSVWNVIDLVIVILSIITVSLFYYRVFLLSGFIKKVILLRNVNEYVEFHHLFQIQVVLHAFCGLLVFVVTIRLWKALLFIHACQKMLITLNNATIPILAVIFYQFILMLGFSACGVLLFGTHSEQFNTVPTAFYSLFIISLNLYKSFDYNIFSGFLETIFFVSFIFITHTIYIFYMITLIYIHPRAQEKFRIIKQNKSTPSIFLREEFHYYWCVLEVCPNINDNIWKLCGLNQTRPQKVFRKRNLIRYRNCIKTPITAMEVMQVVTKAIIINTYLKYTTESEYLLLMEDIIRKLYFLQQDRMAATVYNDLFLVRKLDVSGDKRKLTDDKQLIKIKHILLQIFEGNRNIDLAPAVKHRFKMIKQLLSNIREALININVVYIEDE